MLSPNQKHWSKYPKRATIILSPVEKMLIFRHALKMKRSVWVSGQKYIWKIWEPFTTPKIWYNIMEVAINQNNTHSERKGWKRFLKFFTRSSFANMREDKKFWLRKASILPYHLSTTLNTEWKLNRLSKDLVKSCSTKEIWASMPLRTHTTRLSSGCQWLKIISTDNWRYLEYLRSRSSI